MATLGLSAKAASVVKNRILADEDSLKQAARYGDPRYSDISPENRQRMRKKLYGETRENRAYPYSFAEVGSLGANYADEKPPMWRSTFQADYTEKRLSHEPADADCEGSHYINLSNFELKSHSSDSLPPMISSTQRDYTQKYPLPIDKLKNNTAYPPIFRDEGELKSTQSVYSTTFISGNQPAPVINHPDCTSTHFELGDDLPVWTSVTRSNYRPLPPPSPVEFDALDNRKSTVLDNPDAEENEMISTKQADYIMPSDLDRRDLIVDNRATVKDLKSTHFTLGTVEGYAVKSQYQAAYTQHQSSRAESCNEKLKGTYSSVKIEDGEEQSPYKSTHQTDFINFKKRLDMLKQMKDAARDLKSSQSKSSISFGTDTVGFSNNTRSITRTSFGHPSQSQTSVPTLFPKHLRTLPAPAKRPAPPPTGPPHYSPITTLDDAQSTGSTIMKTDYANPNGYGDMVGSFRSQNVARVRAKEFLSGTHFSFGSDDGRGMSTAFREHFGVPSMHPAFGKDGEEAVCSVKDSGFGSTLANTITRFPGDRDTYMTVNSSVYCGHGKYTRPEVILPQTDTVGQCIAPDLNSERVLTTETKRTFIPPEFMVYMQQTA
ncbi:hypothetical protein HDU67_007238 [Dinochytrium kinnereticum]|nr:hypothetical protein HDU67_007238 [Dinochytrium kinnereticum]